MKWWLDNALEREMLHSLLAMASDPDTLAYDSRLN